MRDLTRANIKRPAYLVLEEMGVECFTPKTKKLFVVRGKRELREVPFIHDLLFIYDTRKKVDSIVDQINTLQYRFLRNTSRTPMTIRKREMEQFIKAAEKSEHPLFYKPNEVTPEMCKRKIRIIGGSFDGYIGVLLTTRGSKVKRLLVELPMLIAVSVEVKPEYIQLL
ncbi:UpxY family transcription antiterminator [uncultured Parabacteroides sp.]|uniref:UpxY family transcription antiterminator n=1 Tax=uncultured Parabacteroides sp. TaxID=512312 RepID=UPI0026383D99|nr:UpxY family transcription antiterminator [uncultured Parabacteroides sp.]